MQNLNEILGAYILLFIAGVCVGRIIKFIKKNMK